MEETAPLELPELGADGTSFQSFSPGERVNPKAKEGKERQHRRYFPVVYTGG